MNLSEKVKDDCHDLQGAFTVIQGFLKLIQPELNSKQEALYQAARISLDKAQKIVADLQKLSKL